MTETEDERALSAHRRLKGFGLHMLGYFAAMFIVVPLNLFVYSDSIWFVLPLVGWGSVLAIHAAYAMGLIGRRSAD